MSTLGIKANQLDAAKTGALLLLLGMAAFFLTSLFLPNENLWVAAIRAMSEAGMVGGLADWFAVAALFRPIKLGKFDVPFITAHTAIIPNNKDRIAEGLSTFVQDKFLDSESIVSLIKRHDLAGAAAAWLSDRAAVSALTRHLLAALEGVFELVEEDSVKRLLKDGFDAAIRRIDLSQSIADLLTTLTSEGRHRELFDQAISQIRGILSKETTKVQIARAIVQWLKSDHPGKEKVLPTEWLGEKGAGWATDGARALLLRIQNDPNDDLRKKFDETVAEFIERLRIDPVMAAWLESVKSYIVDDKTFAGYIAGLWGGLKVWLLDDIRKGDSVVNRRLIDSAAWLGAKLSSDTELRCALNSHLESAVRSMAPDFAAFLASHIEETMKKWNATDMARQIELNIGRDLQAIRINGTIVGGFIGLLLFATSELPHLFTQLLSVLQH